MKALALLLAALLLAGCASLPAGCASLPEGSLQITISPDRVAQCKEQGGCALMSQAQALEIALQAYEEGTKAAMEGLDSHGCRRGAI